jgi:spore germination protein KB
MAVTMHSTVLATAVLLLPSSTAKHANQDLWLSPIWAAPLGFLAIWLAVQLNKLYPGQSIVECSVSILGRIAGKIVGLSYIFFLFYANGLIVREYAEFPIGSFLPNTPMIVVAGSMVLLAAYAVYHGLETIARAAVVIVPVVFTLHIIGALLIIGDMDVRNLFPVLENGVLPSIKGAVSPLTYLGQFFLITFMLPFVQDKSKGLKWGVVSLSSVLFIMLLANFSTMMLFGELTGRLLYPVMISARYISIADFLEHVEALTMAIWVGKTFIKITVFYYLAVIGTAQWLNLSDYRPIVLPIGMIILAFSQWFAPNLQVLMHYLGTSVVFYAFTMHFMIPMLLLFAARIRKRLRGKKGLAP